MPRKVLIVSPHFPPVNAPDHQRVRMSLPYFADFGWQPHVLTVDPRFVEGFTDPGLLQTIPPETPVTRVGAVPAWLTRRVGFGGLSYRALPSLWAAGRRLLRRGRFDLVYFSTTVFLVTALGPAWKKRFGVPYVLDLQDPWVNDYYDRTGVRPPGGLFKHGFAQWLARVAEPRVVRGAAHVITVSPAYPPMLQARYPELPDDRFTVLPFGASDRDWQVVRARGIRQHAFDPADGRRHWVYLGRAGNMMQQSLRALFLALQSLRGEVDLAGRVRLDFVGTSYADRRLAERAVEAEARQAGVADLVHEQPERIAYLEGLALLDASDVILILGSDDPGYAASKVFPCVLAGRPILALLHEESSAGAVVEKCRAGTVVRFATGEAPERVARRVAPELRRLLDLPRGTRPPTDWAAFAPYTAREMTRRQGQVFDAAVDTFRPQRRRLVIE